MARTNSAYRLSACTNFLKVYPISSSTRRRTERWYARKNTLMSKKEKKAVTDKEEELFWKLNLLGISIAKCLLNTNSYFHIALD